MLVQRQIGTKIGTGGSSGYQYLRATIRYLTKFWKVFCEACTSLLNVPVNSLWLIKLVGFSMVSVFAAHLHNNYTVCVRTYYIVKHLFLLW